MGEKKFNCYSCKFRDGVAGSAHSSCKHPSMEAVNDNPMANVMSIFASVGRTLPVNFTSKKLNIKANPHGIKSGWFNFPFNFDPVWLENCDGYEKKEEEKQ